MDKMGADVLGVDVKQYRKSSTGISKNLYSASDHSPLVQLPG